MMTPSTKHHSFLDTKDHACMTPSTDTLILTPSIRVMLTPSTEHHSYLDSKHQASMTPSTSTSMTTPSIRVMVTPGTRNHSFVHIMHQGPVSRLSKVELSALVHEQLGTLSLHFLVLFLLIRCFAGLLAGLWRWEERLRCRAFPALIAAQ
eukprot:1160367-Pelagomonas_calceolata.AAC.2